ncbi:hypothetical protein MRX96_040251 [Rhipicephalus microplus]
MPEPSCRLTYNPAQLPLWLTTAPTWIQASSRCSAAYLIEAGRSSKKGFCTCRSKTNIDRDMGDSFQCRTHTFGTGHGNISRGYTQYFRKKAFDDSTKQNPSEASYEL